MGCRGGWGRRGGGEMDGGWIERVRREGGGGMGCGGRGRGIG